MLILKIIHIVFRILEKDDPDQLIIESWWYASFAYMVR